MVIYQDKEESASFFTKVSYDSNPRSRLEFVLQKEESSSSKEEVFMIPSPEIPKPSIPIRLSDSISINWCLDKGGSVASCDGKKNEIPFEKNAYNSEEKNSGESGDSNLVFYSSTGKQVLHQNYDIFLSIRDSLDMKKNEKKISKSKISTSMIRKGKWFREEEKFAVALIRYFMDGLLNISPRITLRAYLSQELLCDPMRVSKKLVVGGQLGDRVIERKMGKILYRRMSGPDEIIQHKIKAASEDLARLRRLFLRSVGAKEQLLHVENSNLATLREKFLKISPNSKAINA